MVVTLGDKGIAVLRKNSRLHAPAVVRQVYDVSGAGDTVMAVLALALACQVEIETAAQLANLAAGAAAAAGAASAVVGTPDPPCDVSAINYSGGNGMATACGGPVTETPVASTLAVRGDVLTHTVTAPPPAAHVVASTLDLRVLLPSRGLDIGFGANFETGAGDGGP